VEDGRPRPSNSKPKDSGHVFARSALRAGQGENRGHGGPLFAGADLHRAAQQAEAIKKPRKNILLLLPGEILGAMPARLVTTTRDLDHFNFTALVSH